MVESKMIKALREYLENLTDEELEEAKQFLKGPDIPKGWISIEDHLPMFMACDIVQGYSIYKVKYSDGNIGKSYVGDHNVWYYETKNANITHWFNE